VSAHLLILDRQHAGKRSRPDDMGAAADIDGDGTIQADEREANLTPVYGEACAALVRRSGASSLVLDPAATGPRMDYSERHTWACGIAAGRGGQVAYAAMHLNAGGGSYGMIGYDQRSRRGRRLADAIGAQLRTIPVLSRVHVVALAGQWAHGLGTIRGIYRGPPNLCGVLLEPLFIDHPEHQRYIAAGGLVLVGEAIARGVLDYFGVPGA